MSDYLLIEGEGMVYWPMCAIPGCQYRQCKARGSIYCWNHSGGEPVAVREVREPVSASEKP